MATVIAFLAFLLLVLLLSYRPPPPWRHFQSFISSTSSRGLPLYTSRNRRNRAQRSFANSPIFKHIQFAMFFLIRRQMLALVLLQCFCMLSVQIHARPTILGRQTTGPPTTVMTVNKAETCVLSWFYKPYRDVNSISVWLVQ